VHLENPLEVRKEWLLLLREELSLMPGERKMGWFKLSELTEKYSNWQNGL